MADKLTFFRLMVKQVAKEAGLVATFMPKPYTAAWGSGHHFNMSLADARDRGEPVPRRRRRARHGAGASSRTRSSPASCATRAALAAVGHADRQLLQAARSRASPTARCRGRRCGPPTATTTARACCACPRNRPAVENRGVDSAANTYLTAAFMLAAGLEGIREGLDPGDPIEDITYDWKSAPPGATRLPAHPARGDRRVRGRPARRTTVFPAQFVQRVRRDEAGRVGRVPRAGHRLGARALPARLLMPTIRSTRTRSSP